MIADRLFNQRLSARKLMRTFYKFVGRYPELASNFNKSPSSMICDSVPMAQLYPYLPSVDDIVISAGCCAKGRAYLLLRTPDAITD